MASGRRLTTSSPPALRILESKRLAVCCVWRMHPNQIEPRRRLLRAQAREPTSPTTKECNSRVCKHIGRWKGRCYNRDTERFFVYRTDFSAPKASAKRGN